MSEKLQKTEAKTFQNKSLFRCENVYRHGRHLAFPRQKIGKESQYQKHKWKNFIRAHSSASTINDLISTWLFCLGHAFHCVIIKLCNFSADNIWLWSQCFHRFSGQGTAINSHFIKSKHFTSLVPATGALVVLQEC